MKNDRYGLADTPEPAANLRARAELMRQIAAIVKESKGTQVEAAARCGITQPRMNDLLRGRVSRFSLDALVNVATASGRRVLDVSYRAGSPGLALHRAALFHLLWTAASGAGVQMATGAAVHAAPRDGARRWLHRAGAEALGPFDLIVDASGAGSPLSPLQARPLGFGAIWSQVPWPANTPLPGDALTQRYLRAERMAGVLPIGCLPGDATRRAAVFWSLPRAALADWPQTDLELWRAEVAEFWPEMAAFLTTITRTDQMTPAAYSHGTLARPHQPALAFIGDAAHRASPQLGQGANMALLDAMALSLALTVALREDPGHAVDRALPLYAGLRRWHLFSYQAMSAVLTPMYQSHSRALPLIRDRLLAPLAQLPPLRRLLSALVSGDLVLPMAGRAWPAEPPAPKLPEMQESRR